MHAHMDAHTFPFTHAHMYTYKCTYIYTYSNTHTQTNIESGDFHTQIRIMPVTSHGEFSNA